MLYVYGCKCKKRQINYEMIFIQVSRMIKYTGYGNAAGMFASKGLLGRNSTKGNYSSDSGDSDTEEYNKYKEQYASFDYQFISFLDVNNTLFIFAFFEQY